MKSLNVAVTFDSATVLMPPLLPTHSDLLKFNRKQKHRAVQLLDVIQYSR